MTPREKPALEVVRDVVVGGLRGLDCKVVLFGSRATGKPGRSSDVDVAILPFQPIPRGLLSQIREDLEESSVPWPVDLVDLSQVDASFRERVLAEGIPWAG